MVCSIVALASAYQPPLRNVSAGKSQCQHVQAHWHWHGTLACPGTLPHSDRILTLPLLTMGCVCVAFTLRHICKYPALRRSRCQKVLLTWSSVKYLSQPTRFTRHFDAPISIAYDRFSVCSGIMSKVQCWLKTVKPQIGIVLKVKIRYSHLFRWNDAEVRENLLTMNRFDFAT